MAITRIFVATNETQGRRRTDHNGLSDGDLVVMSAHCPYKHRTDNPLCDCRRIMEAADGGGSTTTFKVSAVALSRANAALWIAEFIMARGIEKDVALKLGRESIRRARRIPFGAVCERRGKDIKIRKGGVVT